MNKDLVQAVSDYQISDEGRTILRQAKILILVSVTAGGKNTIARKLIATSRYAYVISHTTRLPRINNGVRERDGVEYYFRSEADVLAMLQKGEFIEAKVVHKSGVYGTSVVELEKATKDGKIALLEIEVQGVEEIMKLKSDTLVIFILPPSFEEWQRRIHQRGVGDEKELERRLHTAEMELQRALRESYFHFVINDNLEEVVKQIDTFATSRQLPPELEEKGRQCATTLIWELQHYFTDRSEPTGQ